MTSKFWFVPIADVSVEYGTLKRYFLHSFKTHEEDIMGWDLLRTQLHKYLIHSIGRDECWSEEAHEALSKLMDNAFACPKCNKVPIFNSKWFCDKCHYQITKNDVVSILENLKAQKGIYKEI